jgi:hypothetical protein
MGKRTCDSLINVMLLHEGVTASNPAPVMVIEYELVGTDADDSGVSTGAAACAKKHVIRKCALCTN